MIPRRVWLALLAAFLFHGLLILTARYRLSYDAYVHMFFGDHYAKDWWSLWDPRWYTGFFVSSYPPLVHQLIGLFSRLVGLDAAFAIILWVTLTLYPLAVYAFSRVFAGKIISEYASLGAAFLPSIYLSAHTFGQLPFLFGTLLALFGAASLARYLKEGGLHNLALTIALTTTTMASHHATLLVQPFLILAVTVSQLNRSTWRVILRRLLVFIPLAVFFGLLVIWPFWDWGRAQTIQAPIDHLSRHNFLTDPLAIVLFFLPMYGPLALFIPFAFSRNRRLTGLTLSFFLLLLLGLGDTTPLPRLFFGKGWEWLTYDRFAMWASIALLPFFGIAVIKLRRKFQPVKIFGALAVASLIVGYVTAFLPLQPGKVDMARVVDFLDRDGRARYRYLTFGFGDQLALLSTLTTATTLDGSYHTARTLPELRQSGLAQIDTAFWNVKGLSALDPILQSSGSYGVRWGLVNVPQYIPVLERNGWTKIATLKGGVQVWENPDAVLPEPTQPPDNPLAAFSWGVLPLLALTSTLTLGSLRLWPCTAEKVLRGAYAFLIGLIPLSLGFWYYQVILPIPHNRVYFTYDHALLFLSDALALAAVLIWLFIRIYQQSPKSPDFGAKSGPSRVLREDFALRAGERFLIAFIILASASVLWSTDWRTSLYIALHLWLVFGLILSLRDFSESWKALMLGLCAALAMQIVTGIPEFALQTTRFLAPLGLNWPGPLDASVRGASIVGLANGQSVLRAYGTLPHPNILGGFALLFLLGPAALFLRKEKPILLALLLFSLGVILLVLTFSRSAWLGFIFFLLILVWKHKAFNIARLIAFIMVGMVSFALTLLPLQKLAQARLNDSTSNTEKFSIVARNFLSLEALQMIGERPLSGVGIGGFVLQLAERAGEGYIIEPVHNLFLLAGAELGIPGLLILAGLVILLARGIAKTKKLESVLAGATLTGLGVIGLFDHYLWTLAPGRLTLGLALGLWIGQAGQHDA
jgi:O-antigen ligase